MINQLKFADLRKANIARLPQFKNSRGELAHKPTGGIPGSDWSRADWLEAVNGELGEYANWSKKFRRGDIAEAEFLKHARKEFADVVTYLDILAFQLGIDLGQAVTDKFNEVSERVGCDVRLRDDQVERGAALEEALTAARHRLAHSCTLMDMVKTNATRETEKAREAIAQIDATLKQP